MSVIVNFTTVRLRLSDGKWSVVEGIISGYMLDFLNEWFVRDDALAPGYHPDPELAIATAAAEALLGEVESHEPQPSRFDPNIVY